MNKYIRAAICVPVGMAKMVCLKVFHFKTFSGPFFCLVSPFAEITIERGAELHIGKNFKMRDGAKIRVRKGANCVIGNNVSLSTGNIIACREHVEIGNDVMLSPNVLIYDHDHDFGGGIKKDDYRTASVHIGNNVWVGANTVVLRGTSIGDNTVVGAGCVVKGTFSQSILIVQKRLTETHELDLRNR